MNRLEKVLTQGLFSPDPAPYEAMMRARKFHEAKVKEDRKKPSPLPTSASRYKDLYLARYESNKKNNPEHDAGSSSPRNAHVWKAQDFYMRSEKIVPTRVLPLP